MQSFDLTQENVSKIQILNARLVSLKNLYKESIMEGNKELSDKLLNELSAAQIDYDSWFDTMKNTLNVSTNSNQSWSVDFASKKLLLI